MTFHEVLFPINIQPGTTGGPSYSTQITVMNSSAEVRVGAWNHGRLVFDIGYIGNPTDVSIVSAFFRARRAKLYGFRFRDWSDYKALNEPLVNAGTTTLKLIKTYGDSFSTEVRPITKPVVGTVTLTKNGVAFATAGNWTIDTTTGLITLTAAWPGAAFAWTGLFDVPVRFDTDRLAYIQDHVGQQSIQTLPIIEVTK